MIAVGYIVVGLGSLYAGMLIGGLLRDSKLADAYAAGKVAGLRQARRERHEAEAELDAVLTEWEQAG